MTWWIWNLFLAFSIMVRLFILALLVFLATRFWFLWIAVILEAILIAARILFPRLRESRQSKAVRIQQQARDRTGADLLGSAIHTAGHPLLDANQPVVLALKGAELSIYGYESPRPIDTLSVKDLQSLDLIVFDDDHIPHVSPIDNTAQAMQLTFRWLENPCTCSFRRFYRVRAIEWYQAIQRSRLAGESSSA